MSGFGLLSPQSLPLQLWTAFTFPTAPSWIICTTLLWTGCEWIWMPIWETILASFAAICSARHSCNVCVSGFCVYTCLPALIARIVGQACMWSGADTFTESNFSLSNISRQSV